MRETRIPYSLQMARARRAGRKTQTRRIVKGVKHIPNWGSAVGMVGGEWIYGSPAALGLKDRGDHWHVVLDDDHRRRMCTPEAYGWGAGAGCPYGQPGDLLLPTEPWRAPAEYNHLSPIELPSGVPIWLDSNGPAPEEFGRYRHGQFLPKALIQARDEIVAVRVERLQDISEVDAQAEGFYKMAMVGSEDPIFGFAPRPMSYEKGSYRFGFEYLWEQINGPGSWDTNPLVWVVEFRMVKP